MDGAIWINSSKTIPGSRKLDPWINYKISPLHLLRTKSVDDALGWSSWLHVQGGAARSKAVAGIEGYCHSEDFKIFQRQEISVPWLNLIVVCVYQLWKSIGPDLDLRSGGKDLSSTAQYPRSFGDHCARLHMKFVSVAWIQKSMDNGAHRLIIYIHDPDPMRIPFLPHPKEAAPCSSFSRLNTFVEELKQQPVPLLNLLYPIISTGWNKRIWISPYVI